MKKSHKQCLLDTPHSNGQWGKLAQDSLLFKMDDIDV